MSSFIISCEKILLEWLDTVNRKPIILYGDLQSGKKTLARSILKKRGYLVIDPLKEEINNFHDGGIDCNHAYIMRTEELGLSELRNVVNAPVVYVCNKLSDLKVKKSILENKYKLAEFNTGNDFRDSRSFFDPFPEYKETVKKIRHGKDFEEKLCYALKSDFYLPTIVHQSYLLTNRDDLKSYQESSESISLNDSLNVSFQDRFETTTSDFSVILNSVIPVIKSKMDHNLLSFEKPKREAKMKKKDILTFSNIYPPLFTKEQIEKYKKEPIKSIIKVEVAKKPIQNKRKNAPKKVFNQKKTKQTKLK